MHAIYEELRIALHLVWRRRWLALAVAWGICLVGWLVIAFVPNSYESRARIFVRVAPGSRMAVRIGLIAAISSP